MSPCKLLKPSFRLTSALLPRYNVWSKTRGFSQHITFCIVRNCARLVTECTLGMFGNIPPVASELHLDSEYDRLAAFRRVWTCKSWRTSERIKQSLFESQRQVCGYVWGAKLYLTDFFFFFLNKHNSFQYIIFHIISSMSSTEILIKLSK